MDRITVKIRIRSGDHRVRRFLIRACGVFVVGVVVAFVAVSVPAALTASVGSLLIGAWCWYRATVVREARGGHIYCPNDRVMTESWKS
jgi:hypothetical protein